MYVHQQQYTELRTLCTVVESHLAQCHTYVHIGNRCVVYPVIVCTCSDSTGQPSSPAATPVPVVLAIVIILMIVISIGGIMIVLVVCLRWKHNHGQYRIAAGEGT